jgi:L-cysteine S-thiosulfotransferase
MKLISSLCLSVLLSSSLIATESLSMSSADKAMYEEMLENNPADLPLAEGEELFDKLFGEELLANILSVKIDALPKAIAGFPMYLSTVDKVITLSQLTQLLYATKKLEIPALKDKNILYISAYIKSLANDEKTNINIYANKTMTNTHNLGKKVFYQRRGGRGLSCNSCHSEDIVGQRLRMQILPDLGSKESATASTWPAYRMTKSEMVSLDTRFQQCMKNALLAPLPLGSKEMVALEVYITNLSKGNLIAIPGLKR